MYRTLAVAGIVCMMTTSALALDAVDAKGKKIGEIVGHQVDYDIDSTQSTVIAKHGKESYVIYMGRQELAGTHNLYYETTDCTGEPWIEMDPAYRWDISVAPSGVCPLGNFWIMKRNKMKQIVAQSVYIPRADYRGDTDIGCEPHNLPMWVTPLQNIGPLNTTFHAPYAPK